MKQDIIRAIKWVWRTYVVLAVATMFCLPLLVYGAIVYGAAVWQTILAGIGLAGLVVIFIKAKDKKLFFKQVWWS